MIEYEIIKLDVADQTNKIVYLAKNAAMLILRLVSGVTISVFEKSILPSPGWGMGKPTPIPAATCTGTTELDAFWDAAAPAGGMIAKLAPEGSITLSLPVPEVDVEDDLGATAVVLLMFAKATAGVSLFGLFEMEVFLCAEVGLGFIPESPWSPDIESEATENEQQQYNNNDI